MRSRLKPFSFTASSHAAKKPLPCSKQPKCKPWHVLRAAPASFCLAPGGMEQAKAALAVRAAPPDEMCFDTQSRRDEPRCDKEQTRAKARCKHGLLREPLQCAFPPWSAAPSLSSCREWAVCHCWVRGSLCCLHAASIPFSSVLTLLQWHDFNT